MYKVLLHSLLAHSLNYSLALSHFVLSLFLVFRSLQYNNNNNH